MIKYHIFSLKVKFLFILFVLYGYTNAQSLQYSHNLKRDNIDQILAQADNIIKKRTRLHCPYCMGIGRTPYGAACGYCGARGYYIDEYKEKQKNIMLADSLALCANRLYEKRKFKAAAETYYSVVKNWVKTDYLHNEMIGLSTEERNSFWNQRGMIYDRFYSLCHLLRPDSALNSTLYNSILQTKGLLLHTETAIHDLIEQSQDQEIRQIYNLWTNLRDVFYTLKPLKTDERIIDIDTIGAVKEKLESYITTRFERYYPKTVTWENIKANLNDGEVALEIVCDGQTLGANEMYLIIDNKLDSPQIVFDKDIVQLFNEMQPNIDVLYFSPMGKFYNEPIETTLNRKQTKIFRLSSTRQILNKFPKFSTPCATIYGGLYYTDEENKTNTNNKDRGAINDSFFLPATENEIQDICKVIEDVCPLSHIDMFMGYDGTKESFFSLSRKGNNILHIATHGYYNPMQNSPIENDWENLHNSYLLMSYSKDEDASIIDNRLTAAEISLLDLHGLDMVSLSACETAKGDITGDGVFGLQRGFKKAGANSILMSLWKVDDEATCKLMTEFYSNWIGKKMTKHDALEAAKKTVRETKGWEDSKYWAAFILLDGLD